MRSYNGFTAAVQDKSTRWMFAAIKKKQIPEYPAACDCCGQTEGKIGYHAESYAVPFGPHIVAFDVCHLCHVFIHADRSKYYARIGEYVSQLMQGHRFRNFATFNWAGAKAKYLNAPKLPKPIDPKLYGHLDDRNRLHDIYLMHRIMKGEYNPEFGANPFFAPDTKKVLFHTQEALAL